MSSISYFCRRPDCRNIARQQASTRQIPERGRASQQYHTPSKPCQPGVTVGRRSASLFLGVLPFLAGSRGCQAADVESAEEVVPLYFGNGCFWGRQKEFVDVEKSALGRAPEEISAVVGYAGGRRSGPDGLTCYYYGPREAVYERLGHAEVVQLELRGRPSDARRQMEAFADAYFKQFRKTPFGMIRLDPQDAGPGYRNVIGLPGGVDSPLFQVLKERNVNGMKLVSGSGNDFENGKPLEDDKINTIYVLDSDALPFHRAEVYHQFHDGIGKPFPRDYKVDQKRAAMASGRVGPTGCPEMSFF